MTERSSQGQPDHDISRTKSRSACLSDCAASVKPAAILVPWQALDARRATLTPPLPESTTMTCWIFQRIAALLLILLAVSFGATAADKTPRILGWVEEGLLLPEQVSVKIKLDTGALTSSLDARDLEAFERDGEKWVRFKVELKDSKTGKPVSLPFERRVERNVRVRGAGGAERRPVMSMRMCIGDQVYDEQFSLNDRDRMLYPVLIGRRTLEHLGAVDASRTFTLQPKCGKRTAKT
ncbi:RimK/LysX family protein [Pseudomonas guguanensis]|nr:RimK/LysX family protein [Pseudomonas guguanensis]MDR8017714.1 RimK/LysX family protein [Pseudomonas guguanensis]